MVLNLYLTVHWYCSLGIAVYTLSRWNWTPLGTTSFLYRADRSPECSTELSVPRIVLWSRNSNPITAAPVHRRPAQFMGRSPYTTEPRDNMLGHIRNINSLSLYFIDNDRKAIFSQLLNKTISSVLSVFIFTKFSLRLLDLLGYSTKPCFLKISKC